MYYGGQSCNHIHLDSPRPLVGSYEIYEFNAFKEINEINDAGP